MKFRRFWQGLLFTAFIFTGLTANAGLILTLEDDLGNSTTVSDDAGIGFVKFEGALGSWTYSTSTGVTNPMIGSDTVDEVHLDSMHISGGSGTLTITLTRTGLERSSSNWMTFLGGTTEGSVSFATLLNGVVVSEYLATTPGFSWTDSGHVNELEPYAMSLVATISHTGGGDITSFDYHLEVPEPSVLALLGSGLVLTGWAGMRRRRQAAA